MLYCLTNNDYIVPSGTDILYVFLSSPRSQRNNIRSELYCSEKSKDSYCFLALHIIIADSCSSYHAREYLVRSCQQLFRYKEQMVRGRLQPVVWQITQVFSLYHPLSTKSHLLSVISPYRTDQSIKSKLMVYYIIIPFGLRGRM